MEFLTTIFYILLFIVCLSILVMVHEAGHLVAAKAFKVFCFEYSIGFGPKLFSKKRKNGETYFSLRAIPLGGFVSMYGESDAVPDGFGPIDESRSLNHIKRWKKCIVLVAGVTMNVVLAILVFFLAETCCTQHEYSAGILRLEENSIAYNAGLRDQDRISLKEYNSSYFVVDEESKIINHTTLEETPIAACLVRSLSSQNDVSWDDHLFFVYVKDGKYEINNDSLVNAQDILDDTISFTIKTLEKDENGKYVVDGKTCNLKIKVLRTASQYFFESTGLKINKRSYHNNFGMAFKKTFDDFGNASTAIVRGIASIFTGHAGDVGGIIAIGFVSRNALESFGAYTFLSLWGMISVNLAIVNLLPFPGLDGCQLLVTIIEGIRKKEINPKAKGIVSIIGLVLLFGLMFALIIKDIIVFVIR